MSWLSEGIRKVRKGKVGRFFDRHKDEMATVAGFALGGPGGAAVGRMAGSSFGKERAKNVGQFARKGMEGFAAGSLASAIPGVDRAVGAAGNKIGGSIGQRIASQAGGRMGANVAGSAAANATPTGVPPASAPNIAGAAGANAPGGAALQQTTQYPSMLGQLGGAARQPVSPMLGGGQLAGAANTVLQQTAAPPGQSTLSKVGSTLFGSAAATGTTLQGAGMLAQGAGAYQAGKVEDRRLSMEEEEMRRRREQEERMGQFLGPYAQQLGGMIQQRMANYQPYQYQPYQRPGA
jgi:hypothetical protein